ncbi:MAG: dockerin type I domain-containing protein [Candidatus Thermoplasmatota archaeon]
MRKKLLVIGILLLLGISNPVSGVIVDPSMQFIVQNETYTVNATMEFEQIIISDTYIVFNDTGFYVASPNSITIKLVYINDDISGASNGERVLDFYATTSGGTVVFDLSGFPVSNEYLIRRNGNVHATSTASGTGFISFSNGAWSGTQRFQVYQQAQAPVDTTPPQITAVTRTTSNPLDTTPTYGWVNVSCTVTDNVAVSSVVLRIRSPSGSWNNVSMTAGAAGLYYYRTTSAFSTVGYYSYSIQARDPSNNVATSSTVVFSMPPNWDVNRDGKVTILDLVLISNHYEQTGGNGWIREDVDNNGAIQVFDLVMVSGHFGEEW